MPPSQEDGPVGLMLCGPMVIKQTSPKLVIVGQAGQAKPLQELVSIPVRTITALPRAAGLLQGQSMSVPKHQVSLLAGYVLASSSRVSLGEEGSQCCGVTVATTPTAAAPCAWIGYRSPGLAKDRAGWHPPEKTPSP